MIISASRRTDIPAFFSDWFFNRLEAGYVYVRNPIFRQNVSEVILDRDNIDGIVFWTKNPLPMLDKLDCLSGYNYYFLFTLNAYANDIELNVPSREDLIIPAFKRLSGIIGSKRNIWRYDPILFTGRYTADYHIEYFGRLAETLKDYTEKCIISFLDINNADSKRMSEAGIKKPERREIERLAKAIAEIAQSCHIKINSCAEEADLERYGITHAGCIDKELLESIAYPLNVKKDNTQRKECGCVKSIDIGENNTCKHGCLYCYASFKRQVSFGEHNADSPLLMGSIMEKKDTVKVRTKDTASYKTEK
jgi:DNA repair photolyase